MSALIGNTTSSLLAQTQRCLKATTVVLLYCGVAGCATLYEYIDNNRIVTPESSAVVGPLVVPAEANQPQQVQPDKVVGKPDKPSKPDKPGKPIKEKRVVQKQSIPASGAIAGKIDILDADNKPLPATGIMLTLTRTDGRELKQTKAPQTHSIDMENKTYMPGYIAINKSDRLSFVNSDNIKHNVFSSTGKNAFDLGTYGKDIKREVALNDKGIVKVYCNIHPGMALFVSVNDGGLSTVADENGTFSIEAIPPGEYNLHVWHIRDEKTLTVNIENNKTTEINATLKSTKNKNIKHKNKYGKDYKAPKKYRTGYNKKPSTFDDEYF